LLPVAIYAEEVTVLRVIDGDTFVIVPDIKVRLIGANTPEIRPAQSYGRAALRHVQSVFRKATKVRLEQDGDKTDRYGRRLAMVYVTIGKKEILLNETLIEQGLARYEPNYRYSKAMKQRFKAAEEKAKTNKKNLWRSKNAGIKPKTGRND
jgi:micrococcal nuclease